MKIREANIWDSMEIVKMWVDMMDEIKIQGRVADETQTEKFLFQLIYKLASQNDIVLVAFENGSPELAGFMTAYLKEASIGSNNIVIYSDNMYIKKEHRAKGIDKEMRKFGESMAIAKGAKEAMYETVWDDRQKAHKALGYESFKIIYKKEL